MRRLIVNADDFGLTKGVNHGIIEGFEKGIVTSTTLMVNMPCVEHAVKLKNENPNLGVGIHLTLTKGQPINKNLSTITDKNHNFYSLSVIENVKISIEEVYCEFKTQIEKFIELTNDKPSHIDGHHHIHMHENFKEATLKLAKEYDLPVRGLDTNYESVYFTAGFYGNNVNEEFLKSNNDLFLKNDIVEIMVHPAYLDPELLNDSSYNVQRVHELSILTSNKILDFLKDNNIKLINYKNVKKIREDIK